MLKLNKTIAVLVLIQAVSFPAVSLHAEEVFKEQSHLKRNWGCGSINKNQPIASGVFFSESSCCEKACDKSLDLEYHYNGTDGKALEITYRFPGGANESPLKMRLPLSNNSAVMETKYCPYKLMLKVVDAQGRITVEEYAWRE